MIYIYRRQASEGATLLADALNDAGIPARRTQGGYLRQRPLRPGRDILISWGDYLPVPEGVVTLNNLEPMSKFTEATTLRAAQVPTVQVSQTRPPARQNQPQLVETPNFPDRVVTREGWNRVVQVMEARFAALPPPPPPGEWLPRLNNHIGGSDLLHPPVNPAYYSLKEDITEEYRLHMFQGKSIRAGIKVGRDREGQAPHPWIRSFDSGWIIRYQDFKSTREMRDLAARACTALNLQLGAVDMGRKRDGSLIVLEVNRAPGIEGGTVDSYVKAIENWQDGDNA